MDAQQQALITSCKQAMQGILDHWATLKRDDQAFRNAVFQHTGTHPLTAPAGMTEAMAPIVEHYHKLLAQLTALGV
jgi:hypothetical protein